MSSGQETNAAAPSRASIEAWLRGVIAEVTGMQADAIDVRAPLTQFGIDSATALIVTDMLIEWLGVDLDPTLLYEHETIDALSIHLEGRVREAQAGR